MSLKSNMILISRASKGMAIALVLPLATLYTNVRFLVISINVTKEVEKLGSKWPIFVVNVSDELFAKTVVKDIWPAFGSNYFIKNNANYGVSGSAESISARGFKDKYNMNKPKNMVIDEIMIHALNQKCLIYAKVSGMV